MLNVGSKGNSVLKRLGDGYECQLLHVNISTVDTTETVLTSRNKQPVTAAAGDG